MYIYVYRHYIFYIKKKLSRKRMSFQTCSFWIVLVSWCIMICSLGYAKFWVSLEEVRNGQLVGGFNPFEKYSSTWESSPNTGQKLKIFETTTQSRMAKCWGQLSLEDWDSVLSTETPNQTVDRPPLNDCWGWWDRLQGFIHPRWCRISYQQYHPLVVTSSGVVWRVTFSILFQSFFQVNSPVNYI